MTIGIYRLEFAGTSKCYIGQSTNIEYRFTHHLILMRKQESSIKLNEAYRIYGNPTVEILCECSEEELNKCEAEAIEIFDAVHNGFNTCASAGGKSSLCGEEHHNSQYSNARILEVLHYLVTRIDLNIPEIAKHLDVSKSVVLGISSLLSHKWLEQANPVEYSLLRRNLEEGVRSKNTKRGTKASEYKLVSPSGEIHTITNTMDFAKSHGLDKSHLSKLCSGERKSHKGWKLCPDF